MNLTFNRPTLITLTAPTCSGKSYLLDGLIRNHGVQKIVSTTTRLPRKYEVPFVDYDFISLEQSKWLEENDRFAELIEFRGTRYGVTKEEMSKKMGGTYPPAVVLEPKGLAAYEQYCAENHWNIFKIFVETPEDVRIQRLNERTTQDAIRGLSLDELRKVIAIHSDRLLSITGWERTWHSLSGWDVVVPGDNYDEATKLIAEAIARRNESCVYG